MPPSEDRPARVVFVCTGNICRSPVAEKIFTARLADAGLADDVTVSSVGTGPWHVGEPMDARAAAALAARGYDTAHVAAQVSAGDLGADLLVPATRDHARDLRAAGADPERVRLLRSFDPDAPEGAEVPDPYYGGDAGFDEVVDLALDERHFEVELRELRLAVGAQVLVAQAARDLEVLVVPRDHQQLLIQLRRLRQGEQLPVEHAARHQVVARALGRGLAQKWRFDLEELPRVEEVADEFADAVPRGQDFL